MISFSNPGVALFRSLKLNLWSLVVGNYKKLFPYWFVILYVTYFVYKVFLFGLINGFDNLEFFEEFGKQVANCFGYFD